MLSQTIHTQESVVGVRLEEFLWTVQIETEWQKDFDVWFLLKQCWVDWHGVLQLVHADCVFAFNIALGIQRIHYLLRFSIDFVQEKNSFWTRDVFLYMKV